MNDNCKTCKYYRPIVRQAFEEYNMELKETVKYPKEIKDNGSCWYHPPTVFSETRQHSERIHQGDWKKDKIELGTVYSVERQHRPKVHQSNFCGMHKECK